MKIISCHFRRPCTLNKERFRFLVGRNLCLLPRKVDRLASFDRLNATIADLLNSSHHCSSYLMNNGKTCTRPLQTWHSVKPWTTSKKNVDLRMPSDLAWIRGTLRKALNIEFLKKISSQCQVCPRETLVDVQPLFLDVIASPSTYPAR